MADMQLYNCTVNLNGETKNAVFKVDVTAAEIVLLKFIHAQSENAGDPVKDIVAYDLVEGPKDDEGNPTKVQQPKGRVKRTDAKERARLGMIYSLGEKSGARLVSELLGVEGVPLPRVCVNDKGEEILPPVVEPEFAQPAENEPPIRRTRAPRAEAAAA